MNRDAVIKTKRIVIKIGSSTLTGADGTGLDSSAVTKLAAAVAELKSRVERLLLSHLEQLQQVLPLLD